MSIGTGSANFELHGTHQRRATQNTFRALTGHNFVLRSAKSGWDKLYSTSSPPTFKIRAHPACPVRTPMKGLLTQDAKVTCVCVKFAFSQFKMVVY